MTFWFALNNDLVIGVTTVRCQGVAAFNKLIAHQHLNSNVLSWPIRLCVAERGGKPQYAVLGITSIDHLGIDELPDGFSFEFADTVPAATADTARTAVFDGRCMARYNIAIAQLQTVAQHIRFAHGAVADIEEEFTSLLK